MAIDIKFQCSSRIKAEVLKDELCSLFKGYPPFVNNIIIITDVEQDSRYKYSFIVSIESDVVDRRAMMINGDEPLHSLFIF